MKLLYTARNVIYVMTQLEEIWKLRPLNNLVELQMSDNPVTQLPHSRLYVIFHLRTLDFIDGKQISFEERQAAHLRFNQGCYSCCICDVFLVSINILIGRFCLTEGCRSLLSDELMLFEMFFLCVLYGEAVLIIVLWILSTGEMEKVMEQLQKKEAECKQLSDAHHKSVHEVEETQKKQTALEEVLKQQQSRMKQLNQEVETKSDLVCVFGYLQ